MGSAVLAVVKFFVGAVLAWGAVGIAWMTTEGLLTMATVAVIIAVAASVGIRRSEWTFMVGFSTAYCLAVLLIVLVSSADLSTL